MEEQQQQSLLSAFNNMLRASGLAGHVDAQRTALAFSSILAETEAGQPVDLGPLYDFLIVNLHAPEPAVREAMVFFQSREARLQVSMKLPAALEALSEAERNELIAAFSARGAHSGVRTSDHNAPRSLQAGRTSTPQSSPAPLPGPSGSPDGAGKTTRRLVGLLVVVLVGGGVLMAVQQLTKVEVVSLQLYEPAGLPCASVQGSGSVVVCTVPTSWLNAEPAEAVQARGQITKAAAEQKGYKRLLVYTAEDNKLRWTF